LHHFTEYTSRHMEAARCYRPPETYSPPVVTSPSIAPADPDYVEPFVFKSILEYDPKFGKRGEEDSPD
jgi:hypothetical protein